ncbi:putative ferric-chelate reductase 1 homolog [Saccostrea echinata]|uniref:putative ferric-chelate reductase 1 homolog n=1 Tax=Saccostrea echinata TaxID=191078 RepID=UPI002A809E84|nr:putative ferric-chelate reductase 1 homolog [Saccostrea echinata]XP_061177113.1 putative ferric-chelate reductase 1 homolog [Saccostrea echinata]XP_061177114.1 putative ferric-chelate reductase 1 homolog [Saccostrea echinata]
MFIAYVGLILLCGCHGYPSGAPESACDNMTPIHGAPPQTTSSPYVITMSSSHLTTENNLTITISSKDGQTTFKGFLLEVFTNLSSPIRFTGGEFKVPDNAKRRCIGGATHTDHNPKLLCILSWNPTNRFKGIVKFRATVVQSLKIIWKNIESESVRVDYLPPSTVPTTDITTMPISSSTQMEETTTPVPFSSTKGMPFDYPHCRKGFGCFKPCLGKKCDAVVQWRRQGKFVDFSIISRLKNQIDRWIAIGISPTGKMSKTSVVMCILYNNEVRVLEGINEGYSFSVLPNTSLGLINITTSVIGQILKCSFSRKINVTGDFGNVYSLMKKYYIILGNGPVTVGTPKRHEKIPVVSAEKVDFLLNQTVGFGEQSMLLYKLHGSLMIFAWIFLSSIGIITARYYKSESGDMMLGGVKVWFAIHRTVMSLVFIITTAAFVIIFIQVGTLLQETDCSSYLRYHPGLGIAVMALTVVNPTIALFRCNLGHKYRHVFYYFHMFIGTSAQILAAITIYFGVNLEKSNTPVGTSNVVIAYIVTYIIIEVILESEKYFSDMKDEPERQHLLQSSGKENHSAKQRSQANGFKLSILMIHFLCMSMYCLILIYLVITAPLKQNVK